jgi:hypothetical protein
MSNSNTSQRRLFKDLQKIQSEELPGLKILHKKISSSDVF